MDATLRGAAERIEKEVTAACEEWAVAEPRSISKFLENVALLSKHVLSETDPINVDGAWLESIGGTRLCGLSEMSAPWLVAGIEVQNECDGTWRVNLGSRGQVHFDVLTRGVLLRLLSALGVPKEKP